MTTLDVERMTVAVHLPDGDPAGRERVHDVDRVLRRVAGESLAHRLSSAGLPTYGEWCVRRVATTLAWAEDASAGRLEADWVDALLAAIGGSLTGAPAGESGAAAVSPGVVHYRHRDEAVLDLVGSVVAGRSGRRWAWQQLGLLPATAADDRELVLMVLGRHPHLTLLAVRRTVAARGAAPLHRLLGAAGWTELARLAAEASGGGSAWAATGSTSVGVKEAESAGDELVTAPSPRVRGSVVPDSALVRALAGSGVRADRRTARAWAVLALLDVDPAGLARADGAQRVDALTDQLGGRGPRLGEGAEPTPSLADPGTEAPGSREHVHGPDGTAGTSGTAPEPTDDSPVGQPSISAGPAVEPDGVPARLQAKPTKTAPVAHTTAWGGLPFLLGAADAATLPELLDDARLAGRGTRWVVHRLGGVAADAEPEDPGRLALCGLPPSAPAPTGAEPTDDEQSALDEIWVAWRTATHAALTRSDTSSYAGLDGTAAVHRLVARTAEVRGEPGWLDVVLRMDEVDVDVRIAGLDLDPGWVPWLGTVVRFRYE